MTPEEVLRFAKEKGVEQVDLRFLDFPGLWQHFTVPLKELTLTSFVDGFGFDGSSLRGWQAINESDDETGERQNYTMEGRSDDPRRGSQIRQGKRR